MGTYIEPEEDGCEVAEEIDDATHVCKRPGYFRIAKGVYLYFNTFQFIIGVEDLHVLGVIQIHFLPLIGIEIDLWEIRDA